MPSRLASAFLVLISLPACGDLFRSSNEIYPTGSEVHVVHAYAHGLTTDRTPVRTDLYPYQPGNSYITTGPPLSFVFPKSAYASEENMRGGPQSRIRLRIDRRTMRPIGSLLESTPNWPPNDIRQAYRHFIGRDLHIDIASNAHEPAMDERENVIRRGRGRGPVAARICGFEMRRYHRAQADKHPLVTIAGVELPPGNYAGPAIADNSLSRMVSCTQYSPICRVSFGFENRVVSNSVRTNDLCNHRQMTPQVIDLLKAHQVR